MNNDTLLSLYNIMCNLYLCDQNYVNLVFDIIKNKTDNEKFIAFLDYFEEQQYKIKCSPINWNYYNNTIDCTNDSYESYNCKLKRMFNSIPSFFRLLYELRIEEKDIINTFRKRKMGFLGHEIRRTTVIEKKLNLLHESILNINKSPENYFNEKKMLNLGLKV